MCKRGDGISAVLLEVSSVLRKVVTGILKREGVDLVVECDSAEDAIGHCGRMKPNIFIAVSWSDQAGGEMGLSSMIARVSPSTSIVIEKGDSPGAAIVALKAAIRGTGTVD